MKPFVEQMISIRDGVAGLANEFGNPNIISLIVRKKIQGNSFEYLQIIPDPVIQEEFPTRETVDHLSSVEGLKRIFDVKGISRKYSEEQLRGVGIDYLIGAQLNLGSPVGGKICNLVTLSEQSLTWDMQLVERISEQNYYL